MTATIHKLHRHGAPDTSIDAGDSIDTTALEQIVLNVIRQHPDGIISDEVRDICAEDYGITAYSSVTARYRSLADKGAIQFIGKRPGASGRQQRIMTAKPTQMFLFDNAVGDLRS